MSTIDALYRWLSGDVSPDSNRVLSAALEHAEPIYAERIANILLDRRHETAWAGLVANYDRLNPDLRRRLAAKPEQARAGVSLAARSTSVRSRENALAVLGEQRYPRLAYLAADALRDVEPLLRTAGASALRRIGEHILEHETPPGDAEQSAARSGFVRALADALRLFERHGRIEVLETGLWFAKELGEHLWEVLSDHHSRCGHVALQHLRDWNNPRLAGFLLLALPRPGWRRHAMDLLNSWREPAQLVGILRNSDLLRDARVRGQLSQLQRPAWFTLADNVMHDLPADARSMLPYWVCSLGFTDAERVRHLERWQTSTLPELHRSAVYALASLNQAEAVRILARVASRPCPMQQFARWYVAGRQFQARRRQATNQRTTIHLSKMRKGGAAT